MVSQWSWMFWRVVMSARLRAYLRVRSAMTRSWCAGEHAVGQADAHHEVLGGFAFAAGAAGDAEAVALGVDAPPFEVEAGPLGSDGVAALRANSRTSSQASQGFLASLRRSDFWALVSFTSLMGALVSGIGVLLGGVLKQRSPRGSWARCEFAGDSYGWGLRIEAKTTAHRIATTHATGAEPLLGGRSH